MSPAKMTRIIRAFMVPSLLLNVAFGVANALTGHAVALVNFAVVMFLAGVMTFQTVVIRRLDAREREAARPRPDYAAIARMEREVWGKTFEHEGAAGMTVADLNATMGDLAERATAKRRQSRAEMFEDDRRAMQELARQHRQHRDYTRDDDMLIRSGAILNPGATLTLPSGKEISSDEWAARGGRTS